MKEILSDFITKLNDESGGRLIQKDTEVYVQKLLDHAKIIGFRSNNNFAGLIAFYANDVEEKKAFLSIIGVDKRERGNGVARMLIESSIFYLKKKNFKSYSLEVSKENRVAVDLYTSLGFEISEEASENYLMTLLLEKF